jgi:ElaA protein
MISWHWAAFEQLALEELYEILQVRQQVFSVEQHCAYLDADGLDQCALHLMGRRKDPEYRQLVAYLRVLPPGSRFPEPSIGRLLTARPLRGTGIGRAIMHEALTRLAVLYPHSTVRISAQQYLEGFYQGLGFTAASGLYQEDGIPHREMVKSLD